MARRLTTVAAVLLIVGSSSTTAAAESTLQPRTQTINFNIGCQQDDPNDPRCSTTSYWLGLDVGDNSVGSLASVTPLDWITYRTGGYRTQEFTGGDTLDDSYILRADEPITGQITIRGFIGGREVAADSGVYVEINALPVTGFLRIPIGSAEVTKAVVIPGGNVYEFQIEVPETLDGVEVGGLVAAVGQRHITALQYGFMNGQGGSWFRLPFYEEVTDGSP